MAAAGNFPMLTLGGAPVTSGALFVKARNLVEDHLPEPYGSVPLFNDDPLTTHQDVLDVLDKTLADLGGMA